MLDQLDTLSEGRRWHSTAVPGMISCGNLQCGSRGRGIGTAMVEVVQVVDVVDVVGVGAEVDAGWCGGV